MVQTAGISALERSEQLAQSLIGRHVSELPTPCLVLDLAAAERNIERMARHLDGTGVRLRPHIKVHKSPELARRQCDAGAIGVTTATVGETLAMARSGLAPVLLANQIVTDHDMTLIGSLARESEVIVAVDADVHLERLSRCAGVAGATIGIAVEVDIGMGRCGARTSAQALALARSAEILPGLELRGVMGYEGHCSDDPVRASRERRTRAALHVLSEVVLSLTDAGMRCELVSAGGTGTYDITARFPGVTEIQAGSYALMDCYHALVTPEFEFALTVCASVISRHGSLVICDAGRKALGDGLANPRLAGGGVEPAFVNEEHSGFRATSPSPRMGERIAILPGYAPTAVNLHPAYVVTRNDVAIDVWPVVGRHGEQ
jgi:D-serine deaminase-like pyridoxal phosphate-dependent protein